MSDIAPHLAVAPFTAAALSYAKANSRPAKYRALTRCLARHDHSLLVDSKLPHQRAYNLCCNLEANTGLVAAPPIQTKTMS